MASQGSFDNPRKEFVQMWSWIWSGICKRYTKTDPDLEQFHYIEDWLRHNNPDNSIDEDGNCIISSDEIATIWDKFVEFLFVPGPGGKSESDLRNENHWQVWRGQKDETFLGIGLDECFRTDLSVELATTVHTYSTTPESIVWRLVPAKQDGFTFFMGAVPIKEIDAVSSVPAMPNQTEAHETAKWILNPRLGENKWQRKMDKSRVLAIRSFAESSSENLILNSIMLYVPPDAKGIEIDSTSGEMKIDFGQFLHSIGHNYIDCIFDENENSIDSRPVWILDGQHRTRGLALSKRGCNLVVPIIVMFGGLGDDSINLGQASKLFTEINTLGADLSPELQYYLAYRFKIQGSTSMNDFGLIEDTDSKREKIRRRANRFSYRIGAELTSKRKGTAMHSSIQLSKTNSAKKSHYTINTWMKNLRQWFTNYPYPLGVNLKFEDISKEISNYFEAWQSTANRNTTTQSWNRKKGVRRWVSNRGSDHSYLEQLTPARSLLILYPILIKMMEKESEFQRPYSQSNFETMLKPLQNVDWLNEDLRPGGSLVKGGEQVRQWVLDWVVRAIKRGVCHTEDEVMTADANFAKLDGAGLFCTPYNVGYKLINRSPRIDSPTKIIIPIPRNSWNNDSALTNLSITIDGVQLEYEKTRNGDEFIIEISTGHISRIKEADQLTLTGRWSNPNGSTTFTFDNVFVEYQ